MVVGKKVWEGQQGFYCSWFVPGGFAHGLEALQQIGAFQIDLVAHRAQRRVDGSHRGSDLIRVRNHHACNSRMNNNSDYRTNNIG